MLNSALNYLTTKRKRFKRSDTAPTLDTANNVQIESDNHHLNNSLGDINTKNNEGILINLANGGVKPEKALTPFMEKINRVRQFRSPSPGPTHKLPTLQFTQASKDENTAYYFSETKEDNKCHLNPFNNESSPNPSISPASSSSQRSVEHRSRVIHRHQGAIKSIMKHRGKDLKIEVDMLSGTDQDDDSDSAIRLDLLINNATKSKKRYSGKNNRRAKSMDDRNRNMKDVRNFNLQLSDFYESSKNETPHLGTFYNPILINANSPETYVRSQAFSVEEFLLRIQQYLLEDNMRKEKVNENQGKLSKRYRIGKKGKRIDKQNSMAAEIETNLHNVSKSVNECFVALERGDFVSLLRLIASVEKIEELQTSVNELNMTLLDVCSLLNLSNEFFALLMLAGVDLGPILTSMVKEGPLNISLLAKAMRMDPLGESLLDKLQQANKSIDKIQNELNNSLKRANQMAVRDLDDSSATDLFHETNALDQELEVTKTFRDYITDFLEYHKQLNRVCPSAHSVRIMVSKAASIIVKITPPKYDVTCPNAVNSNKIELEIDSETSEEGFSVRCQNDYCVVLRYRIEWSTDSRFLCNTHSVVVEPIFLTKSFFKKIEQTLSASSSMDQSQCYIIKSFYELYNLKPSNQNYYIRVYALSLTGWSAPTHSFPACVNPSTWYQCSGLLGPQIKPNISSITEDNSSRSNRVLCPYVRYLCLSHASMLEEMLSCVKSDLKQWVKGNLSDSIELSIKPDPSSIESGGGASVITFEGGDGHSIRAKSPKLQRRRSLRSLFNSSGFRFTKHTKSGLYIAVLCYTSHIDNRNQMQHLVALSEDCLPLIRVMNEEPALANVKNDLIWLSKLAASSNESLDLKLLNDSLKKINAPSSLTIRLALIEALFHLKTALGCGEDFGKVFPELFRGTVVLNIDKEQSSGGVDGEEETAVNIDQQNNTSASYASIILIVKRLNNPSEATLSFGLRWTLMHKFLRRHLTQQDDIYAIMTQINNPALHYASNHLLCESLGSPEYEIISRLTEIMKFSSGSNNEHSLRPGLYIAFVQMQTHLDQSGTILTFPEAKFGHMLPIERIRNRYHVSKAEWASVRKLSPEMQTAKEALDDLGQLNEQRFLRALIKAWERLANKLCFNEEFRDQCRIYLPEIIQVDVFCSFIVITPPIDQICLAPKKNPQFPSGHGNTKGVWMPLSYVEGNLASIFDPEFYRFIANLSASLDILIPMFQHAKRQSFDDNEIARLKKRIELFTDYQSKLDNLWKCKRWISDTLNTLRDRQRVFAISLPISLLNNQKLKLKIKTHADWNNIYDPQEPSLSGPQPIDTPSFEIKGQLDKNQVVSVPDDSNLSSGTLRVFCGYKSGLPSGTSLRVLVTATTTSSQIVKMIVKQVAFMVVRKNTVSIQPRDRNVTQPNFEDIDHNFCLCISVGRMERILPDLFHPLLLQAPWRAGKLVVRNRSEATNSSGLVISTVKPTTWEWATFVNGPEILHSNPEIK